MKQFRSTVSFAKLRDSAILHADDKASDEEDSAEERQRPAKKKMEGKVFSISITETGETSLDAGFLPPLDLWNRFYSLLQAFKPSTSVVSESVVTPAAIVQEHRQKPQM